ncbi:MAG: hypothetical protein V4557_08270 [Bacteroidota bacterium]
MKNSNAYPKHFCLRLLLIAATFNSCYAQNGQDNGPVIVNEQNSFRIENKQVGQCIQPVPVGWQSSSNKEGTALDLYDVANTMYAGYVILPVNTAMGLFYDKELYNKDPQRSIIRVLSIALGNQYKDGPVYYTDEINQTLNGYQLRSFASANYKGVVLYRIFPGGFGYSYIECMRIAVTRSDIWEQKGELVAGIAFGISCNAVLVQHDVPSIPRSSSLKPSSVSKTKKEGYGYNVQLGTEECHNPRTGQNFRVTSEMWSSTGPDGPGYYGMSGNERIKMAPGRSN